MPTTPLNDDTDLDEATEIDTSRVETRTSRKSAPPAKERQGLPAWSTFAAIAFLAFVAIWTHYAKGPVTAHVLIAAAFLYSLSRLFSMESKPNDIGAGEFVAAAAVSVTVALFISSPSIHPFMAKIWKVSELAPALDLQEGPKKEMLVREGNRIKPTDEVKENFQIVVLIAGRPYFVTKKDGVEVDPVGEVEVYLQDRVTGATSPSIPFKIAQLAKSAADKSETPKPEESKAPKADEKKDSSRPKVDPIPLPQDVPPAADAVPPDSAAPAAKPATDPDPAKPAKDPDSDSETV